MEVLGTRTAGGQAGTRDEEAESQALDVAPLNLPQSPEAHT